MTALNNTFAVPRGSIHTYSHSEPYWEATREKRILIQYCLRTKQYQFFPRPVSIATGRTDLEWKEVDGKGEIFSYSITHRGIGAFRGHEPYAVVIIRLNVGVDVISNLVNCSAEDIQIGLRVKPCWMPLEDGRHLLLFEPDEES